MLEIVHAAGRPLGVKELAAAAELKLGTTYHLVNTLLYEGYLVRDEDRMLHPGRLPGPGGAAPGPDRDPRVHRALGRAAFAVDDTVVVCRLDGAETRVSALAAVPGAACAAHYPVDAHALSHLLAAGRAIIAHRSPADAARALELTRRAAAERGEVFDAGELEHDLAATAQRRWCALSGGADACVAAPVLGPDGHARAAVAVVVRPRRLRSDLQRFVSAARRAAQDMTSALGETPGVQPT